MYQPKDLEGFLKLFTFAKKRDLERHSRKVLVHQSDFVAFILECKRGALPFRHRAHFQETVPAHLVPSRSGLKDIADNDVGQFKPEAAKAVRGVFQLFDERRCLAAHMFYTRGLYEWHFFSFDQRDTEEDRSNHWRDGAHIH